MERTTVGTVVSVDELIESPTPPLSSRHSGDATLPEPPLQPAEEHSSSFGDLLKSLAALHEQQQGLISTLSEENASLKARLQHDRETSGEKHNPPRTPEIAAAQAGPLARIMSPDVDVNSNTAASEEFERTSRITICASDPDVPEPWPEWELPVPRRPQQTNFQLTSILLIEETTGKQMLVTPGCVDKLVVRPNSIRRLSWDFLSSLMVCYDVVTIPLMAFALGDSLFLTAMDWITTSFWTLDMPCSFLTGFNSDGIVEMRPREIARQYVRSWFFFDLFVIIVDWSSMYAASLQDADMVGLLRFGRTARAARILRAVRLLRFVKLQRVLSECLELINSESVRAAFNVTLAVAFIIAINHYMACGWYFIGKTADDNGSPNWIEKNSMLDRPSIYRYMTALHWSLTQFTPASMEIRPYNLAERMFSIFALLFALITFSSFLGSITASITQLRKNTTEAGKQQYILRTYFSRNKVSSDLSRSIWKYLRDHHFAHQTRSNQKIKVLEYLPPHLSKRLSQELYGPYVTRSPFWYHFSAVANEAFLEVCQKTITEKSVVCHEDIFLEGQTASCVYFIVSGFLVYNHQNMRHCAKLCTGSSASEPALWVKWVHCGPLVATTSCDIIVVHTEKCRKALQDYRTSFPFAQRYAKIFRAYMQRAGEWQTDVWANVNAQDVMVRQAWVDIHSPVSDDGTAEVVPEVPAAAGKHSVSVKRKNHASLLMK